MKKEEGNIPAMTKTCHGKQYDTGIQNAWKMQWCELMHIINTGKTALL